MRNLLTLTVLIAVAGCAGPAVKDHGALTVTELDSFAWQGQMLAEPNGKVIEDAALESRVAQSARGALEQMGYVETASDMADFHVYYKVTSSEINVRRDFPVVANTESGVSMGGNIRDRVRARLTLQVVDARSGEPVWRGTDVTDFPPELLGDARVRRATLNAMASLPAKR